MRTSIKGPWKVAVGVNLNHFETLTVEQHMRLQQLLGHQKVLALGEFGMECTIAMAKWSRPNKGPLTISPASPGRKKMSTGSTSMDGIS